jgi:hypothetical protein
MADECKLIVIAISGNRNYPMVQRKITLLVKSKRPEPKREIGQGQKPSLPEHERSLRTYRNGFRPMV